MFMAVALRCVPAGLVGHADAMGEIGRGHLAGGEPQGPDVVGDLGGFTHA